MNANEHEWDALSEAWRESRDEVDDGPVRRMVAAQRRRLAAMAAGEVALLMGFAWLSWAVLREGIAAWKVVWVVTLWSFAAIAVSFAWWNRRGMWHAMGRSVAEYRRLRAARQMRAARFACVLFVTEVVVVVAELAWFDRLTVTAASILAASALPLGAWWLWMRVKGVET